MIAKITRGSRAGDIAAYLHGPGKANEHTFRQGNMTQQGGVVIGGNVGRDGETSGTKWAQDLRLAARTRDDITKPIWQVSLRSAPGDRRLSDREWADAGQAFAERMGYQNHPWVMVRHGDDHVHIVTSRVSETGDVWHARQDFRNAQRAATQLEKDYGLQQAPRQKNDRTRQLSKAQSNEQYQGKQETLTITRAEDLARLKKIKATIDLSFPARTGEPMRNKPRTDITQASPADRVRRAREQSERDQDRGRGR